VANSLDCFIKLNLVITTASGWLQRLVRPVGGRHEVGTFAPGTTTLSYGWSIHLPLIRSSIAQVSMPFGQ
jgi:hypothetical protein